MDLRLTFNEDVVNYDKMRPTYVKRLFEDVIQYAHLENGKKILEIGIGTGQATFPFLRMGCKVMAIEPGKELAEFSKVKFSEFSNFEITNTDFENAELENNEYDLVYAATAFHWIPQKIGYTKVYQLLKSGGTLALFWNHPTVADDELHLAMQDVYKKYRPNDNYTIHKFGEEDCFETVETIKKYGFMNVACRLYHQTRMFDAEKYMLLLNTYSNHRAMQQAARLALEEGLNRVINNHGGKIEVQDTMDLYLAIKP